LPLEQCVEEQRTRQILIFHYFKLHFPMLLSLLHRIRLVQGSFNDFFCFLK